MRRFGHIYQLSAVKRSIIIWIVFQALLWLVFGISYIIHNDAWTNVVRIDPATAAEGGWLSTFLFIILSNSIICALLAAGNLLVRFGSVTPGLVALFIQAVSIGWLAGSNGFEVPFESVMAANMQFLRIGLWETTAYALIFAVTLPKSLLIADTFPAKKWSHTRKLKDVKLSTSESGLILIGITVLIIAGIVETLAIIGN